MEYYSFAWDENKNVLNQKKHDISFAEAKTVFYDENAFDFYDIDHSEDEDRFILLGLSNKVRILVVSYCFNVEQSIIRIISSRKATKKESKFYNSGGKL